MLIVLLVDLLNMNQAELISLDLPNNDGKNVPFYTYDGYLEEVERNRLRTHRRTLEQLQITGTALFGFLGYIVTIKSHRLLAASHSLSLA